MYPEGLVSPILLVALVTIAGLCVESSDWSRLITPVAVIAFLSALFGSVIAKLRVLDSFAHMLSIAFGAGASLALVAGNADMLEGGLRERIREIGSVGLRWYLGQGVDDDMEALLVSLLMSVILWLVGYLAAWSMFRRGWLLAALFLPGFLILVNLGYTDDPQTGYLTAFAFISLVLTARHSLYSRQREWKLRRMARPHGLGSSFLVMGVVIALIATSVGWRVPSTISQRAFQPLVSEVSTQALSVQDQASQWLNDLAGDSTAEMRTSGSYTTFGESFAVGGPLELSDQPQALVFADEAPYLTAQHYDSYSGRGWYSTTEDTFEPNGSDGRRYSPEMTFAPNQRVPLSDEVSRDRTSSAIDIMTLSPTGGHLLTVDTYLTSDVESSVRMSWVQLDGVEYPVADTDISTLHRDLQPIASLLEGAELTGDDRGQGPTATNADEQSAIDSERDQLLSRFLDVHWTADESGNVQSLIVTGQIPIYDDVEAVFSEDPAVSGGTYGVLASSSVADAESLANAGTAYPDWVRQRYLSLPDTITPRTVELTNNIAAEYDNPYEQARAIEEYLRTTITYDETVEAPPEDADIVDYLLYERQRGYCEYSASAMTVMLRSISIPARVAVGYYPGDFDQGRGGFLYEQKNAHAWTEVYFPGYGWIPFEPTSSQPLIEERLDLGTDESLPEASTIAIEETPVDQTPTQEATPSGISQDQTENALPQVTPESGNDGSGWMVAAGAGLLAVVGIALVGWLFWSVPLRGLTPASSLFARLRRVGEWAGVRSSPTSTPQEYGRAFVERVPQSQKHVDRIVQMYEVDQFGPDRADASWLRSADEAWQAIKRQVPRLLIRWRK
jgi:transglutaminase-like putative cysteine protease